MILNIHLVQQADCCWALKLQCADSEVFAASLAAFKSEVAAAHRKFDFVQKCWVIAASGDEHLERFLVMMHNRFGAAVTFSEDSENEAKHDEQRERQQQHSRQGSARNGSGERQEGKSRRKRVSGGTRMSVKGAYDVLYLQAGAPLQLIQAAYKTLAKLHHPDVVGGDTATMVEINNAYDVLTRKLGTQAA